MPLHRLTTITVGVVFSMGKAALYGWGPPVPPSFIAPEDIAERMAR